MIPFIWYLTLLLDINSGGLNIFIPYIEREVNVMAQNVYTGNPGAGNSYDAIFAVLAFAVLLATALLAIGGVYYSFIHPAF
jgi:hypothetical protein